MRRWMVGAALWAASAGVAGAQDGASWRFEFIRGDEAGDLTACAAVIEFTNAQFTARLFGEELDFVYWRDDFTLPYDRLLGTAIFRVDREAFLVTASTNRRRPDQFMDTAQVMYFAPDPADRAALFSALKLGSWFLIEFPNGDAYEFPLGGSGRAFASASDCWGATFTGAVSNNPFEAAPANNPFD